MRKETQKSLSRREVQRRFPPGALIVYGSGQVLALVVGWSQTAPTHWYPMSWEVMLVNGESRTVKLDWIQIRNGSYWTLEEWERL